MGIKIVQYSDDAGEKAYAYTHWNAIESKPNIALKEDIPDLSNYVQKSDLLSLTSPNGTKFNLVVTDDGKLNAVKEVKW